MQKQRVKTSMSVPEMGKMLGLGKVESYWLVKKNYDVSTGNGGSFGAEIWHSL